MPSYIYVIIGFSIIFIATTIGSSFVFFFKKNEISPALNRVFNGFAAGVMFAAAIFSLILPIFELNKTVVPSSAIASIGIIVGAIFIWGMDKLTPHLHAESNREEGIENQRLSRSFKMVLAVTIHNIPEGLSIGVAFGVAHAQGNNSLYLSALLLAIGMAIQNVPEGAIVSLPLKKELGSATKAFLYGTFSGAVEPIAAIIGFFVATQVQVVMLWSSSFAAGCMIYVILEEMVGDIKANEHDHLGIWAFLIGFILMMVLDTIG